MASVPDDEMLGRKGQVVVQKSAQLSKSQAPETATASLHSAMAAICHEPGLEPSPPKLVQICRCAIQSLFHTISVIADLLFTLQLWTMDTAP